MDADAPDAEPRAAQPPDAQPPDAQPPDAEPPDAQPPDAQPRADEPEPPAAALHPPADGHAERERAGEPAAGAPEGERLAESGGGGGDSERNADEDEPPPAADGEDGGAAGEELRGPAEVEVADDHDASVMGRPEKMDDAGDAEAQSAEAESHGRKEADGGAAPDPEAEHAEVSGRVELESASQDELNGEAVKHESDAAGQGASKADGTMGKAAAHAKSEPERKGARVDTHVVEEPHGQDEALDGHVEELSMPNATSSTAGGLVAPGATKDDLKALRKTKAVEDFTKRSKIPSKARPSDLEPAELPSLRVVSAGETAVDVDALMMNPQRKALAAQLGFGQEVPARGIPSHAPPNWSPSPIRTQRAGDSHFEVTRADFATANGRGHMDSLSCSRQSEADRETMAKMAERAVAAVAAVQAESGRLSPKAHGLKRQVVPEGNYGKGSAGRTRELSAGRQAATTTSRIARPEPRAFLQDGPRKKQGALSWESLEEMSFEDLLHLDANMPVAQLPPLPPLDDRSHDSHQNYQLTASKSGKSIPDKPPSRLALSTAERRGESKSVGSSPAGLSPIKRLEQPGQPRFGAHAKSAGSNLPGPAGSGISGNAQGSGASPPISRVASQPTSPRSSPGPHRMTKRSASDTKARVPAMEQNDWNQQFPPQYFGVGPQQALQPPPPLPIGQLPPAQAPHERSRAPAKPTSRLKPPGKAPAPQQAAMPYGYDQNGYPIMYQGYPQGYPPAGYPVDPRAVAPAGVAAMRGPPPPQQPLAPGVPQAAANLAYNTWMRGDAVERGQRSSAPPRRGPKGRGEPQQLPYPQQQQMAPHYPPQYAGQPAMMPQYPPPQMHIPR